MGIVLGIDLGTTNSCMAIFIDGKPTVIPSSEGNRLTPSIVAFTDNEVIIGDPAKRQALLNPQNTVTSVKKLMGKKYSEIQEFIKKVPYDLVRVQENSVGIKIGDAIYTPQEISGFILQKMKLDAEAFVGAEVSDVVITVPERFGKTEIKATKEAAEIAGFNVLRIISEPTSACLAYGFGNRQDSAAVAIFDLGGGSLDVSLIEIDDGVFEVLAVAGDFEVGGNDFDFVIVEWLLKAFEKQHGVDLSKDPMVVYRFKEAAEKAKIDLSTNASTNIYIPFISIGSVIKDLEISLSRENFKKLSKELIDKCKKVCLKIIDNEEWQYWSKEAPSELIFVGGSTRIPFLKEEISAIFQIQRNKKINPDEVVCLGAAIQGGVLSGSVKDLLLLDITSYSFGIKTLNERGEEVLFTLIPKHTTIPTKKTEYFITYENEEFKRINQDGGVEYELITPNRLTPENLQSFEIKIIESDGVYEKVIDTLELRGVPIIQNKPNRIYITLDIEADGELSVIVEDKDSRIYNAIRVDVSAGLNQVKFDEIRERFKKNEENLKLRKRNTAILSSAETTILQSEKQLRTYDTDISPESRNQVLVLIDELNHFIKIKDIIQVGNVIDSLHKTWQIIGQEMYLNKQDGNSESIPREIPQVQVFISYSHKDEIFMNQLVNCLSPLKRRNLIQIWNDNDIVPGTLWEEDGIYKNLENAELILLLISSDFIASDYCYDVEIKKALKRHKLKEVLVIPIIIRPTPWHGLEFSDLEALPSNAKPITLWENEDEAWNNVVKGVEKAAKYIIKSKK